MNPVLWFRDQVGQVSQVLQAEFDQLVANIGTGWAVEHDDQGHHTTVTCSGPCSCQQLKLRGFLELNVSSGAGGTPLTIPAGIAFVTLITPGGTPFDIYGISQSGQQPGDELYIARAISGSSGIQFHDRATAAATPLGTEIYLDSEVSPSYPIFHLSGLAPIKLVYMPRIGTNHTNAWAISQVVSL